MYFDPYLAQRMAEERIKDRLREAEESRLIRAAKSHKMAWRWWSPVVLTLGTLVGIIIRPQS